MNLTLGSKLRDSNAYFTIKKKGCLDDLRKPAKFGCVCFSYPESSEVRKELTQLTGGEFFKSSLKFAPQKLNLGPKKCYYCHS
jgi:hypothetical protein